MLARILSIAPMADVMANWFRANVITQVTGTNFGPVDGSATPFNAGGAGMKPCYADDCMYMYNHTDCVSFAVSVLVGGAPCTSVTRVSHTALNCVVPAGAGKDLAVTVIVRRRVMLLARLSCLA